MPKAPSRGGGMRKPLKYFQFSFSFVAFISNFFYMFQKKGSDSSSTDLEDLVTEEYIRKYFTQEEKINVESFGTIKLGNFDLVVCAKLQWTNKLPMYHFEGHFTKKPFKDLPVAMIIETQRKHLIKREVRVYRDLQSREKGIVS